MITERHIDEKVLLDYFSGTLSPVQKQEVETWLQESEENRKIARDIHYICVATDTLQTIKDVNSHHALDLVKKRIGKSNHTNFLVWFQRVAAIFLLPLLVSTIYFATKEESAEFIELKTNPGMVAKLDLPDGSKVWLNSRSYLKYPRKFTGSTRTVEIDGEAYFSVHKDKTKKFIVNTPFEINAEVLGTEFNIEAYKESRQVNTTLVSGSVKLSYINRNNKEESLLMKPEEEVSYNTKTGSIEISTLYVPTLTSWKDGLVILRNTPFEEVLKILSKRFNADFIVKNVLLYDNSFTGTFDGQHLYLILEHFRLSGIEYKFIPPETANDKIEEKIKVELY